jgi:hypothetical protein
MSTPKVTGAYPDTLMPTVYVPRSSAENRNPPDPAVASARVQMFGIAQGRPNICRRMGLVLELHIA